MCWVLSSGGNQFFCDPMGPGMVLAVIYQVFDPGILHL